MPRMNSIIGIYKNGRFSPFIDDYISGYIDFDSQFKFLYEKYFPQIAFRLVYISEAKTKVFI